MINDKNVYKNEKYVEKFTENIPEKTVLDIFIKMVKERTYENFFGTIVDDKIQYLNFYEVYQMCRKVSCFLDKIIGEKEYFNDLNLKMEHESDYQNYYVGNIVGIFSQNRKEWGITDIATFMSAVTNCPLYNTFGVDSVQHILKQTQMRICFVSAYNCSKISQLISSLDKVYIKDLILYDDIEDDVRKNLESFSIKIHYFQDILMNDNNEYDLDYKPPNELTKDLALTICYTSGTTSLPKGVVLTHNNFVATIYSFHMCDMIKSVSKKKEVYISYLPLPHVMERICYIIMMSLGMEVGFFRGNVRKLVDDIRIVRPTFLVGVPKIFNNVYDKITSEVSKLSFPTRFIFKMSLDFKIFLQRFNIYRVSILDKFIFGKIQKGFGNRLRNGLSGSAPIEPHVKKFVQAVLGIRLYEGYGQTEGLAANILDYPGLTVCGSVGKPTPSNAVKFLKYEDFDGITGGEILLKGENIFKGYYKNPKLTKETFTNDGWLKTGDIGEIKNDVFYIIGRKSNSFKTSLGEFIVPERIEPYFIKYMIEDILITGESRLNYIVAIVVCTDKSFTKQEIYDKIQEIGNDLVVEGKLMKFQIPKKIHVLREKFCEIDRNFITATQKKVRKSILKHFEKDLQNMYRSKQ